MVACMICVAGSFAVMLGLLLLSAMLYASGLKGELDRALAEVADLRKRNRELSEELDRRLAEDREMAGRIGREELRLTLVSVAVRMMLMQSAKAAGDERASSSAYQELFFMGVPKDVLDDPARMVDFYKSCVDGGFVVEPGEKPFRYRFLPRSPR